MNRCWYTMCVFLLFQPAVIALSQQPDNPDGPAAEDRAALETQLAESLTDSVLIGSFTVDGDDTDRPLKEERYTLGKVSKLPSGKWQFNTRIQYGEHDVTLPLALDIHWAGDTPMVTLTDLTIPGLGTFTSRVFFYRGRYAGTWQHGQHGGHLFGRIEKQAGAAEPSAERQPDK